MTSGSHCCYFIDSTVTAPGIGQLQQGTHSTRAAYLQVPDGRAPCGAEQLSPAEEALHGAGQLSELGSQLAVDGCSSRPTLRRHRHRLSDRTEPRSDRRLQTADGSRPAGVGPRMSAVAARRITSGFVRPLPDAERHQQRQPTPAQCQEVVNQFSARQSPVADRSPPSSSGRLCP